MLSIVHLGKFYPPAPGGIETHLQTLARSQAALGANVRVICVNHADKDGIDVTWSRFRRTPTIEETDGSVQLRRVGRVASLARLDICPRLLHHLRRIGREGADVVHLHTPNPTMLIALSIVGLRLPLVITHHSDVIRQRILRRALVPFERVIYGKARRIVTTSPGYGSGSSLLGRYIHKLISLPMGIDLEPYLQPSPGSRAHAQHLRTTFGEPIWLMVGRLIYYKGIDVALRALRDIPGTLVVIGTGPLERDLRDLAESLGVAERVVWMGHASRDELCGSYQAATALWFPSIARSEAFGLVQVEALASSCPVINTAIPHSGVSWVSPHGESGLTIPMNDPRALALAASRLLADPELRDLLGRKGRARALQEFSQERMAQRTLDLYMNLRRAA